MLSFKMLPFGRRFAPPPWKGGLALQGPAESLPPILSASFVFCFFVGGSTPLGEAAARDSSAVA